MKEKIENMKKFVGEHKKEIIGGVVVVVGTTVAYKLGVKRGKFLNKEVTDFMNMCVETWGETSKSIPVKWLEPYEFVMDNGKTFKSVSGVLFGDVVE